MAEDLQGLLEKIQSQGLDKANTERDAIVNKAREEAAKIVADAKAEATEIIRNAEAENASLTQRAESAVQQASRDIILKLEGEMRTRLVTVVQENTAAAMTPELMGKIVIEMVNSFLKSGGKITDLSLLVSPKTMQDMADSLKSSLRESFSVEPKIFADTEISGGLKVAINGSDVFYDFSDQAITDIVAMYIGPRLASLLRGKHNK